MMTISIIAVFWEKKIIEKKSPPPPKKKGKTSSNTIETVSKVLQFTRPILIIIKFITLNGNGVDL